MADIYQQQLLDHYRRPCNHGPVEGMDQRVRARNPRCGDELELGLNWRDGRVVQAGFQARACAVCTASGSLLTEAVRGQDRAGLESLLTRLKTWWQGQGELPDGLGPFTPLRGKPARERCLMLAWEALAEALEGPCQARPGI